MDNSTAQCEGERGRPNHALRASQRCSSCGPEWFPRHASVCPISLFRIPLAYELEHLDLARRHRGHVAQPRESLGRGDHRRFFLLVNLAHDANQVCRPACP